MKKLISLTMVVLLSLLFMSNNSYAQNNSDLGKKIKNQFNKLLELTGDSYWGDGEALRVQEKKQLKDGTGEGNGDCDGTGDCSGFVDDDGDGVCDNCGGIGDLDRLRDRDSEGLGLKKRNGH